MYNIDIPQENLISKDGLNYIAIPYTWNPQKSFEIANAVTRYLLEKGFPCFSPISHGHPVNEIKGNPINHETWLTVDTLILRNCKTMILIDYGRNGDQLITDSKGCQLEIAFCWQNQISIIKCFVSDKAKFQ